MQQPCSNPVRIGGKQDIEKHREQIRRLVAEAPDEPTYCEFKEKLSYANKKEKGELVKDVSSFANADLEALGGYGYIIFGVSNDGRVVGIENITGDPPSDVRQIVNSHLERPVVFEYITSEVDDNAGSEKQVAAIVVPDSRRRPHVTSREIKEHRDNNRDTFWLRNGEVWVRKADGRELATAEDLDTIYEGKLRKLVDDQVRPLQQRVERIERDLSERTRAIPKVSFGFAVPGGRVPAQENPPYPVLGNLIKGDRVAEKIKSARQRAVEVTETAPLASTSMGVSFSAVGPTAEEYENYAHRLHNWFIKVQDLFFVDFVFANTGGSPAEAVQVELKMPTVLEPKNELPQSPTEPSRVRFPFPDIASSMRSGGASMQPRPDRIIGPRIQSDDASGIAVAVWEIPKLYHDRPLITRSKSNTSGLFIKGLLISGRGLREHQSQVDPGMQLKYTVRAGNVPETLNDVLILKKL